MTQIESTKISRRRLLALAGVSTGATVLVRRPLFANDDGIVPTMVNAAAKAKISVRAIRRNISVVEGSGGNLAVLSGRDGNFWLMPGSPSPDSQLQAHWRPSMAIRSSTW